MIFVMIGIALGYVFVYYFVRSNDRSFHAFVGAIYGAIAGAVIACVIGTFIPVHTLVEETPIVSLEVNSEESGTFFLGSGSFNGEEYYAFYRKEVEEDEEGFLRDKILAEGTRIVPEDRDDGEIVTTSCAESQEPVLWYFPVRCFQFGTTNTIYVPEGTIVKEFDLEE